MDNRKQAYYYFIKEGYPSVKEALAFIKLVIERMISRKGGCVYVVHGHGSSGNGGKIRKELRCYLSALVRNGKLKNVINGEDFSIFNFKSLELKRKYKGLDNLFEQYNSGVTVIEL